MKKVLFSLSLIAVLMSSCGDEKSSEYSANLIVKAVYDGQPLVMYDEYDYEDSQLFFSRLDFFMNSIELVDEDNVRYPLADIEFINFTDDNNNLEAATAGTQLKYDINKPSADVKSISFGIGVDSGTNATLPADYGSDSPLSQTGYYWPNWDSFIFMKLQGQYDENANGEFGLQFLFHTGTDAQHRALDLPVTLNFDSENSADIVLELDFKKMFEINNGYYDIKTNPVNHDPSNEVPMLMLANNLSNALIVK